MSECRSCGAEVLFVPSAKNHDRKMILNLKPAKGVVLESTPPFEPELRVVHARVVDVYTDHHATCPKAKDWRTK
jgi:hypothetical protein